VVSHLDNSNLELFHPKSLIAASSAVARLSLVFGFSFLRVQFTVVSAIAVMLFSERLIDTRHQIYNNQKFFEKIK
jgi:hypothetical protein